MERSHLGICSGILFFLMIPVSAMSSGLKDFNDSWLIPPNLVHDLMSPANQNDHSNDFYLWSAGQGRLFEMHELKQQFLSFETQLTTHGIPWAFIFAWQKTGLGDFVENRFQADVFWGQNAQWGMGTTHSIQELGKRQEPTKKNYFALFRYPYNGTGFSCYLELRWPVFSSSENVNFTERTNFLKGVFEGEDFAFATVVDRNGDGVPQIGFQLFFVLSDGVGLAMRTDLATGSLGPQLSLSKGLLLLRTSHLVHPQLGITHRLEFSLGRFGGSKKR
ncbi:MAG: hypothetical protein GY780_13555 [bacterium]|nr:hypothetical protein [bacterium]